MHFDTLKSGKPIITSHYILKKFYGIRCAIMFLINVVSMIKINYTVIIRSVKYVNKNREEVSSSL